MAGTEVSGGGPATADPSRKPPALGAAGYPQLSIAISVCSRKDIDVWRVASRSVLKYIDSKSYVVIVPDADVDIFVAGTPPRFNVVGESKYSGGLGEALKKHLPAGQQGRFGWYLQQFIKLAALKNTADSDFALIWDADTVPLRCLRFDDPKTAKVRYYKGRESHDPYFDLIYRLLGMRKAVAYSFVAQCFPIKGIWAREFFELVERRHGKNWADAIVGLINFNEPSGFSEYETLGAFVSNVHREEIVATRRLWLRAGNGTIGTVDNVGRFPYSLLLKPFDFASFETWDAPYGTYRRIPRILGRPLRRLSLMLTGQQESSAPPPFSV